MGQALTVWGIFDLILILYEVVCVGSGNGRVGWGFANPLCV